MTGTEKLIEYLCGHLGYCPSDYGLDDSMKICEDITNGTCGNCWRAALEKEYKES